MVALRSRAVDLDVKGGALAIQLLTMNDFCVRVKTVFVT